MSNDLPEPLCHFNTLAPRIVRRALDPEDLLPRIILERFTPSPISACITSSMTVSHAGPVITYKTNTLPQKQRNVTIHSLLLMHISESAVIPRYYRTCDNPCCINPGHFEMRLGSRGDKDDKSKAGREEAERLRLSARLDRESRYPCPLPIPEVEPLWHSYFHEALANKRLALAALIQTFIRLEIPLYSFMATRLQEDFNTVVQNALVPFWARPTCTAEPSTIAHCYEAEAKRRNISVEELQKHFYDVWLNPPPLKLQKYPYTND